MTARIMERTDRINNTIGRTMKSTIYEVDKFKLELVDNSTIKELL